MKPQDGDYPILPSHIDTTKHFWDAFGNNETEISANWIVRLCQQHCDWSPFSGEEIESFYASGKRSGFSFNRLISGGFVAHDSVSDLYTVHHRFVTLCFLSSPIGGCAQ